MTGDYSGAGRLRMRADRIQFYVESIN